MKEKTIFLFLLVAGIGGSILTGSAIAQQVGIFLEPSAANFFGYDARVMAMGATGIANAANGSAVNYNPALLARLHRVELNLGLSHQRSKNKTGLSGVLYPEQRASTEERVVNNTRFNSAWAVLPVPTYRGSLVLAVSGVRAKNFDRAFRMSTNSPGTRISELETGGLYAWSAAGAVDISPSVSLGATLTIWTGSDNYQLTFDSTGSGFVYRYFQNIFDRYTGLGAKLGVHIRPNRYLALGLTVDSPNWFSIQEDYTSRTDSNGYVLTSTGAADYDLLHPFTFGAGVAFRARQLTLAGDLNFTDWSQLEYKNVSDPALRNDSILDIYYEVLRLHFGAEYSIPATGISMRLGFYTDPLPFSSTLINTDRKFLTFGIGFLIDRALRLDGAAVIGDYGFNNRVYGREYSEKYNLNRIFISAAWRI